jgi:hypothetical protein
MCENLSSTPPLLLPLYVSFFLFALFTLFSFLLPFTPFSVCFFIFSVCFFIALPFCSLCFVSFFTHVGLISSLPHLLETNAWLLLLSPSMYTSTSHLLKALLLLFINCWLNFSLLAPHISSGILWDIAKLWMKGCKVIILDIPLSFETDGSLDKSSHCCLGESRSTD